MLNPYDEIAYPSSAFAETHPDKMATHARLFGLRSAPIGACRVLEIGASDGSNLIPMALGLPGSEFVGFDLAASPVARGREAIEALGLKNVSLFQGDLADVDVGHAPFDFVIAQGMYSWIPDDAREAMMRLVARTLAPGGVGYISYNTLPGGYIRLAIRNELLFLTRHLGSRTERVTAAMGHLRQWPKSDARSGSFQAAVADEAAQMAKRSIGALAHDELSDAYHPLHLHEFSHVCEVHGLKILSEAGRISLGEWLAPPDIPSTSVPDFLAMAQQSDFASTRFFRQSLVVRAEEPVDRQPGSPMVASLHVSSRATRVEGGRFDNEGVSFEMADPALIGMLEDLAAIWPDTRAVADLALNEERVLALPALHGLGMLELHSRPIRLSVGDRPKASPLARWQAQRGERRLTTLRHTMVDVDDEFSRTFLASLDGGRTRAEIAADICGRFELTPEAALAPLGVLLDVLTKASLLVE